MKKLMTLIAALMLIAAPAMAKDTVTRDSSVLPAPARTLITKYFPKQNVNHIKVDKGVFSTDYEVVLDNGTEIDFDDKGNWSEVDGNFNAIPAGIAPKAISAYVSKNWKGQGIVKIERGSRGYDVKLANGVEMEFDRQGTFLRYDD